MKKPTVDQLREYSQRIGYHSFDVQQFLDHYDSNGWRVGRVPMKDWRATVRNWQRHEPSYRKSQSPHLPISVRNKKINELNERKARLMRLPQSAARDRELESIRIQLFKL